MEGMPKMITEVKNLPRKLIVAGNIKIGGKGEMITSAKGNDFQPPVRLKHFKLTTTERGQDGNYIEDIALTELIKEDCMVDSNGDIVGIPVTLMFDDTSLNFPVRRAKYQGATLICTGNGETAHWKMDNFEKPITCPCPNPEGCKLHGKLTVIIGASPFFGQVHKFTTTSKNSVEGIFAGIELIKAATGGRIAGGPLMLTFQNMSTTTPNGAPTTIGVVGLAYRGSFSDMRKNAIERIEADKRFGDDMKMLEDNSKAAGDCELFDENDSEKDFTEEYFPSGDGGVIEAEFEEVVAKEEPAHQKKQPDDIDQREGDVEIINSADILSPEDKIAAQKSIAETEKENAKLVLFNRLMLESDPTKAISLAHRIDKKYLVEYFKMFSPDNMPYPKEQKPVFIEAFKVFMQTEEWKGVADQRRAQLNASPGEISVDQVYPDEQKQEIKPDSDAGKESVYAGSDKVDEGSQGTDPLIIALSKTDDRDEIIRLIDVRFPNTPLNRTGPPSEFIEQAKRWLLLEGKEIREGIPNAFANDKLELDDSIETEIKDPLYYAVEGHPPVDDDTKSKMVELKGKISEFDDIEEWFKFVSEFEKVGGEKIKSANDMTQAQGEFFVKLLQMKADGIPF